MLTWRSVLRLASAPYLFQPVQILRRLRLEIFWRSRTEAVVRLPWGLPLNINPQEAIGYNIASHCVYEPGVTEALWRLTEPGDLAVDAGANLGYTASILGTRVGRAGRVLCFEPHPDVFATLSANVDAWKHHTNCGSFSLHKIALGACNGKAFLYTNAYFSSNRGTAWISESTESLSETAKLEVEMRTLDSIIPENETIGILKMDVQGSEASILKGMTRIFGRKAVRDIIFEEERLFPADSHNFLRANGYSVFGLQETTTGVRCLSDRPPPPLKSAFGPIPNYLATMDPERAKSRLSSAVWRSFGLGRYLRETNVTTYTP